MASAMQARGGLAVFLVFLLVGAGVGSLAAILRDDPGNGYLLPFGSKGELEAFLRASWERTPSGFLWLDGGGVTAFGAGEGGVDHSGTNVQVEGVDESDVVKTDGIHLFLIAGERVLILRAYPPSDMGVVASLAPASFVPDGLWAAVRPESLFASNGRLAVISTSAGPSVGETWQGARAVTSGMTFLSVFDVENPHRPERLYTLAVSGSPQAARLTEGALYLLTRSSAWTRDGLVVPQVCEEAVCEDVSLRRVLHDPEAVGASSFTTVLAVELATGRSTHLSLLAGHGSTVYMSPQHLYLTYAKGWAGPWTALTPGGTGTGHTTIYKLAVEGVDLRVVARGEVQGQLLNQFSLDEWQGFLRVATTTYGKVWLNHLYVLDEDLEVIGSLEGLAPTERIYAARFMGDRAYLVTFKKVDPFFVLDVSDPQSPRVLGELKIPGFSEYLHPVGEDHVLGVGKDAVEAVRGDFAWFLGVKVSLFDVRDVANPVETAQLLLGDRGSSSPVLRDHRAFLPIPARGLVVLPVDLAVAKEGAHPWESGPVVWRGAYVLGVEPDVLRVESRVAHWTVADGGPEHAASVSRSLYIGSTLYTISATSVKATSLDDFSLVGEVILGPDGE